MVWPGPSSDTLASTTHGDGIDARSEDADDSATEVEAELATEIRSIIEASARAPRAPRYVPLRDLLPPEPSYPDRTRPIARTVLIVGPKLRREPLWPAVAILGLAFVVVVLAAYWTALG
jgi:hypothetical protein